MNPSNQHHHQHHSRRTHGPRFEGREPSAEDTFGHEPPADLRGRALRGEGRGPGPEGRGPGRGPERGGRRGPGGGRGRARRGDVRIATLLLLTEEPMHGYQIMEAMAERTGGTWRPSPGAIYPTIAQLEDEGLVRTEAQAGRKLVTLTDAGRALVDEQRTTWGDPFAELAGHDSGPDLRGPLHELHAAARQVAVTGSRAQVEQAAAVLADARRSLYLILAGEAAGDR